MNQKVVIYIILSAILLYLYYKRGGVALFTAFVIVVAGTLFTGAGAREGLSLGGGGGGGDKECAKMGFKPPKIDKKDITGSLEKVIANIKPIANKYWKRNVGELGTKPNNETDVDEQFEKNFKEFSDAVGSFAKNNQNQNKKFQSIFEIAGPAVNPYIQLLDKKTKPEAKDGIVDEWIISKLDKIIGNMKPALEIIELFKNSDEAKGLDKDAKQLLNYLVCLCKHWISIYKEIQKAKGGGDDAGDDAGDDEEDKPKKKKKKATKKKKKSDEDDEDADEE